MDYGVYGVYVCINKQCDSSQTRPKDQPWGQASKTKENQTSYNVKNKIQFANLMQMECD